MTLAKRMTGILIVLVGGLAWLCLAMDYGDRVAAGRYRFSNAGTDSTLVLNRDHSFHEEVSRSGRTQMADGSWRRLGEGGIAFSKEFILVPGQERGPDGSTFATMKKALGLFVSLECSQHNVLWYGKSDSSGESLVGTYKGDEEGYVQLLTLNPDHTFTQSVTNADSTKKSSGTWATGSQGGISFSRGFLNPSGEPLEEDETASDESPKGGHLQIEVAKTSQSGPPTFEKRYFP